ncbi:MAG: hypothetical protein VW879_01865 [Opitutae bacterium]
METKKQKANTAKPSIATLEKMGFTISGHWASRKCFEIYIPSITYEKLLDELELYGENLGKAKKLDEVHNALGINNIHAYKTAT